MVLTVCNNIKWGYNILHQVAHCIFANFFKMYIQGSAGPTGSPGLPGYPGDEVTTANERNESRSA